MTAYVFPGQGSQFPGMGKDLYESSKIGRNLFEKANDILGFSITDIMFGKDTEALKQTQITQPAIFLHSVILTRILYNNFKPDMVAGHSLGEFSALVASDYLNFEDGLRLVLQRAMAMQKACEIESSTMAAVLGLENKTVEQICSKIDEVVVPANYNYPGQLVISGSEKGIDIACKKLVEVGAKRVLRILVGGAFHSPLMQSAETELEKLIIETTFSDGICPIYQNVTATSTTSSNEIKRNLIKQLTSPVRWTQTMKQMITDGLTSVIEVGPGKVLQGLFKKIDRKLPTQSAHL